MRNEAAAGRPRLIVLSGPSGVGKTTVAREVLARTDLADSVSATTRQPRPGERDGVDYRFVDAPTFRRMAEKGELLEWAEVFGNLYGTPAEPVERALRDGRGILLEIDVQGGIQVARTRPDAVLILLAPPDEQALAERLSKRGTENEDVKARRLAKAKEELATARASGVYTHEVVNRHLPQTVNEVLAIIQKETSAA